MEMLENTLPTEYYKYIKEDNEIEMTGFLDRDSSQTGATHSLKSVIKQIVNFNFKINFMKMLMNETYEMDYEENIKKNKIQFLIIKDLLRLGIDNYINYLNRLFVDQLNGYGVLRILDLEMLNEIGGSKLYRNYVEKYRFQAQTFQNSQKKPKLSRDEKTKLEQNCKKYDIADKFSLILGPQLLVRDEKEFLQQVKRCIIELIYFLKEEVRTYGHQRQNLTQQNNGRYRQLILLIHHFNMFILLPKVFPQRYDPNIDYDTGNFQKKEQYLNNHNFKNLARQIHQIIARFQN